MQESNIACVFMLSLDFRRLWKFTNGCTQHILILFRYSNVLLSQKSMILFPEKLSSDASLLHAHATAASSSSFPPSLLATFGLQGISPTQHHVFISTTAFELWGTHCFEAPECSASSASKMLGRELVKGSVCNILPRDLMHMLFSLYKESVAYLET